MKISIIKKGFLLLLFVGALAPYAQSQKYKIVSFQKTDSILLCSQGNKAVKVILTSVDKPVQIGDSIDLISIECTGLFKNTDYFFIANNFPKNYHKASQPKTYSIFGIGFTINELLNYCGLTGGGILILLILFRLLFKKFY